MYQDFSKEMSASSEVLDSAIAEKQSCNLCQYVSSNISKQNPDKYNWLIGKVFLFAQVSEAKAK